MDAVDRESRKVKTQVVDRIQILEDRVMGVLDQVTGKLTAQETAISVPAAPSAPPVGRAEQPWAEVVRKNRVRQNKPVAEPIKPAEDKTGVAKMLRTRPLALAVKMDGEDFPALLRTVRRKVDPGVTGNSITNLRRTNAGDLLVEINGGNSSAEIVKAELERSLGPEARVRKLGGSSTVEIRDMDAETTGEELLDTVNCVAGDGEARLVSLRKVYGGAQTAVVAFPATAAKKICSTGRLRVGLVYARARPIELPTRCYRCLTFGHGRRECSEADRGSSCRRCGSGDHKVRECSAGPEAAEAFRVLLADTARRHNARPRGTVDEGQAPSRMAGTGAEEGTANHRDD